MKSKMGLSSIEMLNIPINFLLKVWKDKFRVIAFILRDYSIWLIIITGKKLT